MARSVADVNLLFKVLVGTVRPCTSKIRKRELQNGARFAWYTDDGISPVTKETRDAVAATADALIASWSESPKTRRAPAVERGADLCSNCFQERRWFNSAKRMMAMKRRWLVCALAFGDRDDTPPPTLDEYIRHWQERDRLRGDLLDWIATTPLIVCPVGATAGVRA